MLALCHSSRSAAVRHGFGCALAVLRRVFGAATSSLRSLGSARAARPTKLAAGKTLASTQWPSIRGPQP